MTAADRTELREMLKEHVAGIIAIQEAKDNTFKYQIDNIENLVTEIKIQTTKTNGRVNELEKREIGHYQTCPNSIAIRKLEDAQLSVNSVKKWLIVATSIAVAVSGIIIGIVELMLKK
jgi:hypothetical protein